MASETILNNSEKDYLRRLGLTAEAMRLYELLLQQGSLTARQAAALNGDFASAEYRLFRQLERLGLVRRETGRPIIFVALPKIVGLKAAYIHNQQNLRNVLAELHIDQTETNSLGLIIGRQALYNKYVELAEQAKAEICIYAIGIAYSGELLRAQQKATKRGVRVRHVVQQIKPSNFHVAHKWQRLGVDLRYSPAERGFHLTLVDSRVALVTFSNPQNTDDRLTILTENSAAVRLFESYFRDIWAEARQVTT